MEHWLEETESIDEFFPPQVGAITVQLILMGMIRGQKTLMMQERARTITRERELSMGTGMESSAQVQGWR